MDIYCVIYQDSKASSNVLTAIIDSEYFLIIPYQYAKQHFYFDSNNSHMSYGGFRSTLVPQPICARK